MHISQLTILFESGFISKSEMDKSALLRKMAFDLQANNEWDMSLFRTSENWKKLLQLADEIRISLMPIILGEGKRFFEQIIGEHGLHLLSDITPQDRGVDFVVVQKAAPVEVGRPDRGPDAVNDCCF